MMVMYSADADDDDVVFARERPQKTRGLLQDCASEEENLLRNCILVEISLPSPCETDVYT